MSWAHPVVLALVPAALGAGWWICRRIGAGDVPFFAHIKRRWADRHGLSDRPAATSGRRLRGLFLALGAAAALLALARPQWGEIAEQSYEQSREVMLALDLSRSMLADDIAPNRLARAKLLISALLDELQGERVGLIVFAGTAFVQSPLSADYEVLRDFLDQLEPSYLPQGGTDYEAMLGTAVQAFGQQGAGDRYLVVLSDGEALDHDWKSIVPGLRERGIQVIGLGIGTPDGALVPDGEGVLIKDEQGAAVLSRLEPQTLQELAAETGGTYRDAATWVDIAELVTATVEQGQRGNYIEERNLRLQDRYQWFLVPALLCLLLSYWIEFPVSPLARALPTRGRRLHPASAPAIAAALLGLAAWHSSPRLAIAAVSDSPPSRSGTASQPNPLTATVAALSNQEQLSPADYAKLATDTIAFASQPSAPTDATRAGVIDDALAAVNRGEISDPKAADWPALRQQLEQLKQLPEPPPQPQQSQDQQEQNQDPQQENSDSQQENPGSAGGSPADEKSDDADARQGAGQQQESGQEANSGDEQQPGSGGGQKDADNEPPAEGENQQQADAGAQGNPQNDTEPSSGDQGSDSAEQRAGRPRSQEMHRQDEVKPLDAPEAGLGAQEQEAPEIAQPAAQEPAGEPAQQPPPNTRMVGGGRALPDAETQAQTALAAALGQMEHVKDGDAPAVLFDRMNRAEGQPRAAQNAKNW